MTTSAPRTIAFAIEGPIARADLPGLCARVCDLLRNSKARIAVKLDGQILRVTSRNPHHRLGNEYRVYSKRESAFTNSIAESDLIQ